MTARGLPYSSLAITPRVQHRQEKKNYLQPINTMKNDEPQALQLPTHSPLLLCKLLSHSSWRPR